MARNQRRSSSRVRTGIHRVGRGGPPDLRPCGINHNDPAGYLVTPSSPTYVVLAAFHNIQNDNGAGYVPMDSIISHLQKMNEWYAPVRVEFVLAGADSIRNGSWFRMHYYCREDTLASHALNWDPTRYFNIYTKENQGTTGWAAFPWEFAGDPLFDGIRLSYTYVGGRRNNVSVHETGHWLSLWHTETCFVDNTNDCDANNRTPPACYSNGDLICDTTPELGGDIFGCNPYWMCRQRPDSFLVGNPRNHMQGAKNGLQGCTDHFTSEQIARMRCAFSTYRPTQYLGIVESSIQTTVTEFCVGDSSRIRFTVSWNTNLSTNGPDSLKVYGPGRPCTGATTRVAVVTPDTATTQHSVEWTGTCSPGAPGDWRYTIKTSEGPGAGARVTRSECRSVSAVSCPSCTGVILENTIQHTVSQYCEGGASKIKFLVTWDTSIPTSGPDSLKIYPPTGVCPGATWRMSGVTPQNPTTHHSVEWIGTCFPGATGEWRYSIQTSETSAPSAPVSRSQCRPVGAVSCPSCGGGCRPPCEFE